MRAGVGVQALACSMQPKGCNPTTNSSGVILSFIQSEAKIKIWNCRPDNVRDHGCAIVRAIRKPVKLYAVFDW